MYLHVMTRTGNVTCNLLKSCNRSFHQTDYGCKSKKEAVEAYLVTKEVDISSGSEKWKI